MIMSMPSHRQTWFASRAEIAHAPASESGLLREWLVGAATALSAIAVWAVMVWLGVLLVQAAGLLPPSIQP